MQIKSAIKIVSIFLVVLILLLAILLLATKRSNGGDDDTTDDTTTAETVTDGETTAADTTSAEGDGTSEPSGTTDPAETTPPSDTTAPAETTKPDAPSVPTNYEFKKTLRTDNGTALALRADCRGVKEGDKVKVTVTLYLEHRSLEMRARSGCRLSLGDVSKTFEIDAIKVDDNNKYSQLICTVERLCNYGETVSVFARMPFRGVYSGVEIEFLEIDSSITLN